MNTGGRLTEATNTTNAAAGTVPLAQLGHTAEALVSGSFADVRARVQDAIEDRIELIAGTDLVSVYISDIGPTWAVYSTTGDDLFKVDYSIDGAGVITLSDPVEVAQVTTYETVDDGDPAGAGTTPGATSEVMAGEITEATDRVHGRLLAAVGVDGAGGRVFRVQIIAYGLSKNGTRYTEGVMRPASRLYEGAKAFDRHRTMAELNTSTISGLIGTYRNVEATATGIEADLHLLPSAGHIAEALDLSLANQAAGLPPLIGISHDVLAAWRTANDAGRQIREATVIHSVNSADVIADPSAGGYAMRMVAGGVVGNPPTTQPQEINVNYKQLLALLRAVEAAKRPALLAEHAHLIESFGYTPAEFAAEVDADRATEATPAPAAPQTFAKASLTSRPIIDAAIADAKLDAARFREGLIADLPDQFTESDLVASARRFARAAEAAGVPVTVPDVVVTLDERTKQIAMLDAMLDPRASGPQFRSLKEAYAIMTDAKTRDLFSSDFNREVLRECIATNGVPYDSERGTESVSSSTFGYILGDSITRRMIAEYTQPNLQTWRNVVSSIVPVNDFRTQRIDAMGGYGVLPAVNQGAAYNPLTTPGNEEATYTVTKRGGTEDLTLETIQNDDLRMVQRIPVKLGLAAAQTLYRFVWDMFITNITLTRDSVALFNAGHNNTTATALSSTALEVSRKNMRKQAAYGDTSDILSLVPKYLLCPPELEVLAWQLCTSAVAIPSGAPVGAASNTPNIHQGMTPLVIDYWSATSTTAWFLVADPGMAPTIELGFLNGQQDPAMFVQNDPSTGSVFTADKVTYKIRHIYSGTPLDYRAFQRGNS